jgi:hypothetical protein
VTRLVSENSLRRLYLDWVEEKIEDYKESIPRSELIQLAEEVIHDLEINRRGQYQLTEVLLLEEVDRAIYRLLKLPGYRKWIADHVRTVPTEPDLPRPAEAEHEKVLEPIPLPARAASF